MTENAELLRPLAALEGVKPPAPDWFTRSIETPSDEGAVTVRGATIRYSAWGKIGQPGILFVHGGRAHRNWWRPFAPFFTDQFRVAALDLGGMGDSDWRERYSIDCLVDEIFTVIYEAGLAERRRPVVIGHSFGGWATLAAVEREGERLSGAVVIDSPIGVPDPHEGYTVFSTKEGEAAPTKIANRVYATIEEPVKRFRLLPNQPGEHLYILDYIARAGLKKITESDGAEGWTWKFDPSTTGDFDIHFERELLRAARCPLAFIYGEKSAFAIENSLDHVRQQAEGRSPFIMMPEAYHHLMLDQPLGFVATIRALLNCWPVRVGA